MNRCRSDYCSDYKRQKIKFRTGIATNVATAKSETQKFWISWLVQNENQKNLLSGMRIGLHFGFSCCTRKAQASRFGTKTQLAGKTLTPMPPAGGGLTVELWHKSETHIGAAVCSAAWGTSCRRVRLYRLTAHPCRFAPRKRRVRPPWRREENRIKTLIGQFFSAMQKQILIP